MIKNKGRGNKILFLEKSVESERDRNVSSDKQSAERRHIYSWKEIYVKIITLLVHIKGH